MEVLTELEADSALRFLMFGFPPNEIVLKILKARDIDLPAAFMRDIERIQVEEVKRKQGLARTKVTHEDVIERGRIRRRLQT